MGVVVDGRWVSGFRACLFYLPTKQHICQQTNQTADESEEEEDEEEPVLKFEDEPLEATEVVLMPDGSEGVVEGIRRGNVVVRCLLLFLL